LDELTDNEWKFDIEMKSDSVVKSSWLYSPNLNKVFVKINTPLNVYPKFVHADPTKDIFIRAMIVYTSQNDLPEPVKKCPNHKEQSPIEYADHILKCSNVDTLYIGNETGRWFSEKIAICIPMKNVASNEPLQLTFTCQNSCSGGMNRKSTSLVFTLEDNYSNILGRKVMHFKVCSCPRRDKEKDENTPKAFPKKRKLENANNPSTSKKIATKIESDTTLPMEGSLISVPSLPVNNLSGIVIKQEQDNPVELKLVLPNEQIKKKIIELAYDTIAGEMSRSGQMAYINYLNEIQKQIGK
jgi:P53 DNA-binding domain